MLNMKFDFLFGHADGEQFPITNNPEQISAFIMKHRWKNVIITDFLDQLVLETSMGFIMTCPDQQFLANTLLPVLVPMQRGEANIPEFIPHELSEGEDDEDFMD